MQYQPGMVPYSMVPGYYGAAVSPLMMQQMQQMSYGAYGGYGAYQQAAMLPPVGHRLAS